MRNVRNLRESDHPAIVSIVGEWWGRPVAHNLPRLFFQHFCDTSFVVEEDRDLAAFLIGFVSQPRGREAYINFVGVRPDHREKGVARDLYEAFFEAIRSKGCYTVRSITSPVNIAYLAFHRRLGFEITTGDEDDSIPVHLDYNGDGGPKVVFVKIVKSLGS